MLKEAQRKQNKKKAWSYTADQDTLQRIEPLERHLYPPDYEEEEEEEDENQTNANEGLISGSQITNPICERNSWFKILHIKMSKFVERPIFDGIVTGLILLNTVVLSMYYHGMSAQLEFVLDVLNAVSF